MAEPVDPQEALMNPLELFEKYNGKPKRVAPGRRTDISKALTNVLRHSAGKLGLDIGRDGYVPVWQILAARRFQSQDITDPLVYAVVDKNKQRFQLQWCETFRDFCEEGPQGLWLMVRAVQGHSMAQVDADQVLERLEPHTMPQVAVHGSYWDYYKSIYKQSLLAGGPKRSRTHIHLTQWLPKDRPLSGMRTTSELALWSDPECNPGWHTILHVTQQRDLYKG